MDQCPIFGAVSPMASIHKARNQVMGVIPLTITPSNPIVKLLLSVPTTCVLLPRGLSSKWRDASTRRHNDSIELEVKGCYPAILGSLTL